MIKYVDYYISGRYYLCNAVDNDDYDETLELLQSGINPNYETSSCNPLKVAVRNDNEEIVKLLLSHKADPNYKCYNFINYALFNVQSVEVLDLLYKYGANLNATYNSYTLMMIKVDNIEIIKYLLEHGADPDIVNNDGKTAIMMAYEQGYKQTVKLLLKWGADDTGIVIPEKTWTQPTKIKEDICAICHEELDNGLSVLQHICKGQFHTNCLEQWNGPCPICNLNFGKRKYKHY